MYVHKKTCHHLRSFTHCRTIKRRTGPSDKTFLGVGNSSAFRLKVERNLRKISVSSVLASGTREDPAALFSVNETSVGTCSGIWDAQNYARFILTNESLLLYDQLLTGVSSPFFVRTTIPGWPYVSPEMGRVLQLYNDNKDNSDKNNKDDD